MVIASFRSSAPTFDILPVVLLVCAEEKEDKKLSAEAMGKSFKQHMA